MLETGSYNAGNDFTIRTVSTLTRITLPTRRTMYSGSLARFGSERMPERLSSVTPAARAAAKQYSRQVSGFLRLHEELSRLASSPHADLLS